MSTNHSAPDDGEVLDLVSRLATEVAHSLSANYMPDKLHEAESCCALVDQARTVLMKNARHVPVAVKEILDLALSQGDHKPRPA